jgi:predicted DNA-binding WGR domain protein
MRRFEFADDKSNKFWEIEQDGLDLNLRWGRIGTEGQSQTKAFADQAKCTAAMSKLIAEKTGKGYVEVGVAPAAIIGKSAPKPAAPQEAAQAAAAAAPIATADPLSTPPWLAEGEPVSVSRKMVMAALPSRRFPKAVPAVDMQAVWNGMANCNQPDFDATDPELREAYAEALQRLQARSMDGSLLSDAILLALACDMWRGRWSPHEKPANELMLDALAKHKGLEHCVDAFIEMLKMEVRTERVDMLLKASISRTVTKELDASELLSYAEVALRRQLSSAPEAVWQACADKIERAIPSIPLMRKAGLAAQLPERPEISNRLVHEGANGVAAATLPLLLLSATAPELPGMLSNAFAPYGRWTREPRLAATILRERGVDACSILEVIKFSDAGNEALTQIGTPDAIKLLAQVVIETSAGQGWYSLTHKTAITNLLAALQQWPLAGIAALAELGEQAGKDGDVMRAALLKLVRARADDMPRILPWVGPDAQALLQRLIEQAATVVEVAAHADLPSVLADPPWLRPRKRKAGSALALQPLALAPVERWDDIDRDQWLSDPYWGWARLAQQPNAPESLAAELGFRPSTGAADVEACKQAVQAIENGDVRRLGEAWRLYSSASSWRTISAPGLTLLPEAMGVEAWNMLVDEVDPDASRIAYLLAKFGLPALPGFEAMLARRPSDAAPLAKCFGSVGMAGPMARAASKLKKVQEEGRQWLLRFPEHAVCGLIAPALGKVGEERDCAQSALRYLRANGHEALVLDVAARYQDPAVAAAVRAMLDEDPLERLPAKLPTLPGFWAPLGWRRPVLNDQGGASAGKALPDEALDYVGTMLMLPTVDGLYPGIAQLKDACTAESLANFSWDCFSAWLDIGAPSKEGWAMAALGWLGTDDTARKLTPFIRTWPGESAHLRAVSALDVLADIGTDTALMLLNGIAQKVKFKGLQDKAREKIDKIAEARELTTEELEDRLAPDLGLDENGSVLLDFGPRQFRVGFDETLKPYVRDSEGTRLADLPKPKKTDDEALAAAAVERFKLLKKDARTIASQQVLRLEWAMCSRRRWLPAHFRQFLVEHPLVRHLVQRLVWGAYAVEEGAHGGATLLACFRVAEDGSYTTAEDDSYTLPEGGEIRVGLPHALELPQQAGAQFGQLFADYELLQPFAQLGRDTYSLGAEELSATKLERWKGAVVPTGRVLGLVNKGWRRGQAQDAGGIWFFHKPLGGSKVIELTLDPGIFVGMVNEYPEQTLQLVSVGTPSGWGEIRAAESLAILDPIATSELIRDIESLRA